MKYNLIKSAMVKLTLVFIGCVHLSLVAVAQPPKPSALVNPLAQIMIVIIAALALVIGLLAFIVQGVAEFYLNQQKKENNAGTIQKIISVLVVALFFTVDSHAQTDGVQEVVNTDVAGLEYTTFFALAGVITIEILVIFGLLYNIQFLLKRNIAAIPTMLAEKKISSFNWQKIWWQKLNRVQPITEEAAIDLGHDYDGIRELDNRLPPWWLYGFYVCILFAAIYLWRFHVTHSAPSSSQELATALEIAAVEKENYLAKAANNVDENTVTMLDAGAIAAGAKIYQTACAACHLADGGGSVGPNLTDDYWLHGGDIKSIFKTIKYGWPEKGMKAWQDDYSPVQMAQIASFVKSLQGTKPAVPKEPQGMLEKAAATPDSASANRIVKR